MARIFFALGSDTRAELDEFGFVESAPARLVVRFENCANPCATQIAHLLGGKLGHALHAANVAVLAQSRFLERELPVRGNERFAQQPLRDREVARAQASNYFVAPAGIRSADGGRDAPWQ